MTRTELNKLVARYLKDGGTITVVKPGTAHGIPPEGRQTMRVKGNKFARRSWSRSFQGFTSVKFY